MHKYSEEEVAAIQKANETALIKRSLVSLVGRSSFGVSAVQRASKSGYNATCQAIERAISDGIFARNDYLPEYANLYVTEAGRQQAEALAVKPSKVGELVVPASPSYALRSGAEAYLFAVVVSVDPFVLVSEYGDMRWQATVRPSFFNVIGQATSNQLERAMARELA